MAKPRQRNEAPEVIERLGEIAGSAGKLMQQQWELLRAEVREEIGQIEQGVAGLGAGVVLAASGGALATLMVVHGLRRATGLPLWACYGLVGGTLGAAGFGLMAQGRRRIASIRALPQTTEALRENAAWIQNQLRTETT